MNNDNIDESKDKKSIFQMDVKDLFKSDILNKQIDSKLAIIIISIFCLIGMYGYFIVYPKVITYKTTKANLEKAKSKILGYDDSTKNTLMLQEKLDLLTKESDKKSMAVSHDMEDGLFLIGLDNKIRSLGIRLIDYTIEDIVDYTNFYGIPMTLSIEGDYRNVRELLYFLEEQNNITQVMDYKMTTKMTETKKEVSKMVYWTRDDANYHLDKNCPKIAKGSVISGKPNQSGNRKPDSECVGDVSNTIDVQVTATAEGDVSSNISFIVYSSNNNIKLDTDKPESWTPGKNNPFKDTLD